MSAAIVGNAKVFVPDDAMRLPLEETDSALAIGDLVAPLDVSGSAKKRLAATLVSATAYAQAQVHAHGAMAAWALVSRPSTGNVDGLLLIDLFAIDHTHNAESYAAKYRELFDGAGNEAIARSDIVIASVSGRDAVGVYRLDLPTGEGHGRGVEQGLVAHFVSDQLLIEYRVIAQDLAAFRDVLAYAFQLAAQAGNEGREDG